LFVDEDVKELIGGLADEMRRGFAKVDARFEQIDAKIDEKFEESKRHFGVVADDLRSQIQTVAESVGVLDRKIDRVDERLSGELSEIKAMIPISFKQLDGRIRSLETDNVDLQSRVDRLESTAH
jgi:chaperonin cofactor prefoldin